MDPPLHVLNVPIECLPPDLLVLCLILFGRCFLPLLVLFLVPLVEPVLLIPMLIPSLCLSLIVAPFLIVLLNTLTLLFLTLLEFVDQLYRELEVLEFF